MRNTITGPHRIIPTSAGDILVWEATGYFRGTAIFVVFPEGQAFSPEIAAALNRWSDGRFHMDPAPPSVSGGSDVADAIISAGLDYDAYVKEEQGYFKWSPAPTLDEVVRLLQISLTSMA